MLATRARITTAALLLASAGALAAGSTLERSAAAHVEPAAVTAARTDSHADADADASTPATPAAVADAGRGAAAAEAGSETVLGLNPEAPALVATAVAVSIALAAAILMLASTVIAWAVVAAMVAFAALDVREVVHQVGESHAGLAAVAALVLALHAAAALAAWMSSREPLPATPFATLARQ